VSKQWNWLKLSIADLLLVGGIFCVVFRRYLFGIILIFIGIIYRIKYVKWGR